jgi:Tfp pilus assembly protein PilF
MMHWDLGYSYYTLHQYDKAIQEFEKTLKIYDKWGSKPYWVYCYTFLGIAYNQTEQYRKEKKLYKKAEQDFPNDQNLIYRQSVLSISQGDTLSANRYIEKYITISKENSISEADITTNLANMYLDADKRDKAEVYYRQALSLEPDNPWRLNNLAWFLIDGERNIYEGMGLIYKAITSTPDNYDFLNTKGWGLYKQRKCKEALDILQKSRDLRMKNAIYDHEAFLHLEAAKKAVAN